MVQSVYARDTHLVQMLLPRFDSDETKIDQAAFASISTKVVAVEVTIDSLDRDWWRSYGADLARVFR